MKNINLPLVGGGTARGIALASSLGNLSQVSSWIAKESCDEAQKIRTERSSAGVFVAWTAGPGKESEFLQ